MALVLFKKMANTDEGVGKKNYIDNSGGKKRLVCHFTRNKFCRYIGCTLLAVTYDIKGNQIWKKTERYVSKGGNKVPRDVRENAYLLKVCCYLYHPHRFYACH